MRNSAKKKIKGPLAVTDEQIRKIYAIIKETGEENSKAGGRSETSITVFLSQDENYKLDNIDDLFKIPNCPGNRIRRIKIKSGMFDPTVEIDLDSLYIYCDAVTIDVTGPSENNQKVINDLYRIVDKEKDFLSLFLSLNPVWISINIIFFFHIALGLLSPKNVGDVFGFLSNRQYGNFISYMVALWLIPVSMLWVPVEFVKHRLYGNVNFLWDDGITRYKKRRFIFNVILFLIPVGAVGSLLASFVQGRY